MPQIAIVFHSVTGTTAQLASAVADGVASISGCSALVHSIDGENIDKGRYRNESVFASIDEAAAVIFGAPTFMGGPSAQFKAFADASSDRWEKQLWQDKLACGFTVGTSFNGDQSNTLQYFAILAAQHGMIWLGLNVPGDCSPNGLNRLGVQLGASAQSTGSQIPPADLATARYLGSRMAKAVSQFRAPRDAS